MHGNDKGREHLAYLIEHAPTYEHAWLQQQLTVELMRRRADPVVAKPIQSIRYWTRQPSGNRAILPVPLERRVRREQDRMRAAILASGEVTWHPQRAKKETTAT